MTALCLRRWPVTIVVSASNVQNQLDAYSLDPLCCLVVCVHQPLLHVWLEETSQIELDFAAMH